MAFVVMEWRRLDNGKAVLGPDLIDLKRPNNCSRDAGVTLEDPEA